MNNITYEELHVNKEKLKKSTEIIKTELQNIYEVVQWLQQFHGSREDEKILSSISVFLYNTDRSLEKLKRYAEFMTQYENLIQQENTKENIHKPFNTIKRKGE